MLSDQTRKRIEDLLEENQVVLFMKGSPAQPQCGFSHRAVAILSDIGVPFASVDVLSDPEIREGVKVFGNWPTIPQLYVKRELIGGSDIMMEMYETGELKDLLQAK